jgi:DnaJ-domain-containing protein 1
VHTLNNLLRAKYLIGLNYKNDPLPLSSDFLMQQMEWEEELEEIKEIEPLIVFKENIKMNVQKETLKLSKLLDQDRNWEDAQISLGELKFLSNLLTKTTELSHTLSDN